MRLEQSIVKFMEEMCVDGYSPPTEITLAPREYEALEAEVSWKSRYVTTNQLYGHAKEMVLHFNSTTVKIKKGCCKTCGK
jgi:hypothetical protein